MPGGCSRRPAARTAPALSYTIEPRRRLILRFRSVIASHTELSPVTPSRNERGASQPLDLLRRSTSPDHTIGQMVVDKRLILTQVRRKHKGAFANSSSVRSPGPHPGEVVSLLSGGIAPFQKQVRVSFREIRAGRPGEGRTALRSRRVSVVQEDPSRPLTRPTLRSVREGIVTSSELAAQKLHELW